MEKLDKTPPPEDDPVLIGSATYDTNLTHLFQCFRQRPIVVGSCDENGWLPNESSDASLSRQLNFFVPIISWEYNKARKMLLDVDESLSEWWNVLNISESGIQRIVPTYVPAELPAIPAKVDEDGERLKLGTGLDVRMQKAWLDYLAQRSRKEEAEKELEAIAVRNLDSELQRARKRMRYNDTAEHSATVLENYRDRLENEGMSYGPGDPPRDERAPPREEPMVVRAINRPRVSDPTQDNVLAALADRAALARAKLDYFGGIRGQLSVRLDRLRKYLDIVLDDEVNEMAMYEKSLLRSITNDYAHMSDKLQRFAHPHLCYNFPFYLPYYVTHDD